MITISLGKSYRYFGWLLALAALPFSLPASASDDPMTESIEIMMDRQSADLEFLGRSFGPDGATLLSFTSNVDPIARRFSYSLASGTTYLGRSLSIAGLGTYDFTLNRWNLSGAISYGGNAWTPTGTAVVVDPPTFSTFDLHIDDTPITIPPPVLDHEANVTYEQTAARTVSVGVTNETLDGKVVGAYTTFDSYQLQGPDAGTWIWDSSTTTYEKFTFQLHSEGHNDYPGGGAGTFTARVTPVPEPSALLSLAALSVAGLLEPLRGVWQSRRPRKK